MPKKIMPTVPKLLARPFAKLEDVEPKDVGEAYDYIAAENTIQAEVTGLVFATTQKFIEYVETFPDNAPPEFTKKLLLQALERLRRANTEEPSYKIVSMRQISLANPTQYDGVLEDGDPFFIRYANHRLTIYCDDQLIDYQELPTSLHPNKIELGKLRMLCRSLFEFPDDENIMLKSI
jgi:hypothetical protein